MPNNAAGRPRRPHWPAVWVGLVLVTLLALTATLGRPPAVPASGGAAWLPPDGHRQRFLAPDGVHALEWAFDRAPAMLEASPPSFSTWAGVTRADLFTVQLARLSTVRTTPAGQPDGRTDDLFTLGDDGVRAELVGGFDGTFRVYTPGRLDLPDNLVAGRTWSSEGAVLLVDSANERQAVVYRADYTADAPPDDASALRGCLVVTRREVVGEDPPQTSEATWCRRAGFTAVATDQGSWQATTGVPAAVLPDAGFDWATADRLSFTPRTINHDVALQEEGNVLVSALSPPGLLPEGTAVFASQQVADVVALGIGQDPPLRAWRSRPGVRTSSAATFGTTTVAAGASRQLVAYGPAGEWLWEVRLPDLAAVPPVRLGDLAVVATLDGTVAGHDLATGAVRWSRQLPAEIRTLPVAAAGRVLVADQGGLLTCLDSAGAVVWAEDVGPVAHLAVSTGPDPVVVVPNSDGHLVTGLALADGRELWRRRVPTATLDRDAIALADVVLLRGDQETVALDPATGRPVWTWSGRRTFAGIGGGDRALLLAAGFLVLIDGRGATLTEWPVDVGDAGSVGTWLVAAAGRVLVIGPRGAQVGEVR